MRSPTASRRDRSSPRLRSVLFFAALAVAPAVPAFATADAAPPLPFLAGRLPYAPARPLYLHSSRLPEPVLAFRERLGTGWVLYWDDLLETPRFLAPREPFSLALPEGVEAPADPAALELAARAFVEENRELLGAGEASLAPAVSHRIGEDGWLLAFAELGPGGLSIRGAVLRLYLRNDGELIFLKAYLQRTENVHWSDFGFQEPQWLDGAAVEALALKGASEVVSRRLEVAYLEPGSLAPRGVWSLVVADADGALHQEIRDGATGELLGREPLVEHFEYFPRAWARAADLTDVFAPREAILEEPQSLAGIDFLIDEGVPAVRAEGNGLVAFLSPVEEFHVSVLLAFDSLAGCHPPVPEGGVIQAADLCPELLLTPTIAALEGAPPETLVAPLVVDLQPGNPRWVPSLRERVEADTLFDFVFNAQSEDPRRTFLQDHFSGWIQYYHHGAEVLRSARAAVATELPNRGRFLPLFIHPTEMDLGDPARPAIQPYLISSIGYNLVHFTPYADDPESGETYRFQATLLGHEIGHHLIEAITGLRTSHPIEEALADVIAAYALEESKLGYQREGEALLPGPVGRDISLSPGAPERVAEADSEEERLMRLRPFVANGFWRVFAEAIDRGTHERMRRVFYRWLGTQAAAGDPAAHGFEDPSTLLQELLCVNKQVPPQARKNEQELVRDDLVGAFECSLFSRDVPFVRGDTDLDGDLFISDAINTFKYLFGGKSNYRECYDALDADDDGLIQISDGIFTLNFLFLGGRWLPEPFVECGYDETPDDLCCFEFTCRE